MTQKPYYRLKQDLKLDDHGLCLDSRKIVRKRPGLFFLKISNDYPCVFCKLCEKFVDDYHLKNSKHFEKVAYFEESTDSEKIRQVKAWNKRFNLAGKPNDADALGCVTDQEMLKKSGSLASGSSSSTSRGFRSVVNQESQSSSGSTKTKQNLPHLHKALSKLMDENTTENGSVQTKVKFLQQLDASQLLELPLPEFKSYSVENIKEVIKSLIGEVMLAAAPKESDSPLKLKKKLSKDTLEQLGQKDPLDMARPPSVGSHDGFLSASGDRSLFGGDVANQWDNNTVTVSMAGTGAGADPLKSHEFVLFKVRFIDVCGHRDCLGEAEAVAFQVNLDWKPFVEKNFSYVYGELNVPEEFCADNTERPGTVRGLIDFIDDIQKYGFLEHNDLMMQVYDFLFPRSTYLYQHAANTVNLSDSTVAKRDIWYWCFFSHFGQLKQALVHNECASKLPAEEKNNKSEMSEQVPKLNLKTVSRNNSASVGTPSTHFPHADATTNGNDLSPRTVNDGDACRHSDATNETYLNSIPTASSLGIFAENTPSTDKASLATVMKTNRQMIEQFVRDLNNQATLRGFAHRVLDIEIYKAYYNNVNFEMPRELQELREVLFYETVDPDELKSERADYEWRIEIENRQEDRRKLTSSAANSYSISFLKALRNLGEHLSETTEPAWLKHLSYDEEEKKRKAEWDYKWSDADEANYKEKLKERRRIYWMKYRDAESAIRREVLNSAEVQKGGQLDKINANRIRLSDMLYYLIIRRLPGVIRDIRTIRAAWTCLGVPYEGEEYRRGYSKLQTAAESGNVQSVLFALQSLKKDWEDLKSKLSTSEYQQKTKSGIILSFYNLLTYESGFHDTAWSIAAYYAGDGTRGDYRQIKKLLSAEEKNALESPDSIK